MAITSGYFNSVNGDRKYNADQMSEYFDAIVNQGVFQHYLNGLAVSAGTGLSVSVATGKAIIQSKWVKNDAAVNLTISAASTSYARIDAVVIRLSNSNRTVTIAVKDGTPSANPSAPSMTRAGGTYEMALAYVNVAANATSVTVTDKRSDTSVCGWATVAQETSGEVDAMLEAMKTGFDGETYSSPAAMVQGSDEKLQGEIETAIVDSKLLDFVRGIIIRGQASDSTKYVRTDFYYATKNSTIIISPSDFAIGNMAVYFYTDSNEGSYTTADSISNISAGGTGSYTFAEDTYFRLRASKPNEADLTDAEVEDFNSYFNFKYITPVKNQIKELDDEIDEIKGMLSDSSLLPLVRGVIIAGAASSSNKYVRSDFNFATTGSTLVISPVDFDIANMSLYYYNAANESSYVGAHNVGSVSAGQTKVYKFEEDTYFRLRASKPGEPDLTDGEVTKFNQYITFNYVIPIKEGIEDINSVMDSIYFPTSWSGNISSIRKAIGNNFVFGVQTDTHLSDTTKVVSGYTYPAMTKEDVIPFKMLTNYLGFDFIANLGDIIRGQNFDTYSEMQSSYTEIINRYIDNVACPVLFSVGNHDDAAMWTVNTGAGGGNTMNEVIMPSEQYAILMNPSKNTFHKIKNPSKELYYFVDFDQVRVIVLNTRDIPYIELSSSDVSINHHAISETQLDWLESVALDTTKPVIIMCHVPLVFELAQEYEFDGATDAYNILKAFKAGGGTVIGVFCGHTHRQDSATVDGILNVVFANGANFAEIVIVDTDNKTIATKMIGNYGTKTDRSFSYT